MGSLTATQFRYDSGQVILFFDPASSVDTVGAMKTSNPVDYQKFVTVFADHPINSNYELYQAVYSASPAQLSPLMDTREALRMNALLLWKLSFGFDLPADGQFYSFDREKFAGFSLVIPPSSGQSRCGCSTTATGNIVSFLQPPQVPPAKYRRTTLTQSSRL